MSVKNQITGGAFQDCEGNVLALGYLTLRLTKDAQAGTTAQVCSGSTVTVPLDVNGNINGTVSVWPNDILTPNDSQYVISAYSASGQLCWQSTKQITSSPSPFILN